MKPDGSLRKFIDYKPVNKFTLDINKPLPRIDDTIHALKGNEFYTTLDEKSGYWQAQIAEDCEWITAFVTLSGLYEWNRVPFGLKNAPGCFQDQMQTLLQSEIPENTFQNVIFKVLLDDINVPGRTWAHFIHNICLLSGSVELLSKLKNASLSIENFNILVISLVVKESNLLISESKLLQMFPLPQILIN